MDTLDFMFLIFLLLVLFLLCLIGTSYYLNIFKCINGLKIKQINKKYTIVNERECLKFYGKKLFILGFIDLIYCLIIIFFNNLFNIGTWVSIVSMVIVSRLFDDSYNDFLNKNN
ncbi:hypothetical protein [Clostridium estertheticum]|uniref:DUF3784 domain-containing protein n=1 Tax=Clostridium estertheticum subsp. estertheticum TaxID=1552 RepID=A0A1J0GF55_9CLOT|nr:hypothetical protein [Clostridium estertheticum]APC39931.1 hypothetical protein A7L45_07530 [Clostridium estertheticum subsp. estertheticum]MBU3187180.1 hypothetical protein [Clostridium estertheticum]MBZ9614004.1 hypothetical protein [Clostridium estertheticum subsp. laramiense]WAG73960.1 hypothetical protein LL032_00415 [Clostridium estertheticum]